ncbi:MAG TPA: PEP-CTERM sorting domain-containing protein [Myxococcales bacterium LLY-WYZ-16_1]|nr:PEP-CTERM sorting domain-containing protein [Myxococcales bacterium LLY-WYZ-16_1]
MAAALAYSAMAAAVPLESDDPYFFLWSSTFGTEDVTGESTLRYFGPFFETVNLSSGEAVIFERANLGSGDPQAVQIPFTLPGSALYRESAYADSFQFRFAFGGGDVSTDYVLRNIDLQVGGNSFLTGPLGSIMTDLQLADPPSSSLDLTIDENAVASLSSFFTLSNPCPEGGSGPCLSDQNFTLSFDVAEQQVPVPEPGMLALLGLGLAGLGIARRRA